MEISENVIFITYILEIERMISYPLVKCVLCTQSWHIWDVANFLLKKTVTARWSEVWIPPPLWARRDWMVMSYLGEICPMYNLPLIV